MSKKRNPSKAPLMAPMASLPRAEPLVGSWYSMQALSAGVAEIRLEEEIGAFGVTAERFANDLKALGDVSQIKLYINSPGGSVFEGFAIYNMLASHPAWVEGEIGGVAASMGSVVAMACNRLSMPSNTFMMIHRPWGAQGGDATAIRQYADLLDKVEDQMVQAYVKKTGKTPEDVGALLAAETWMSASEAVEAGFADVVLEPLIAFGQIQSKRMQEFTNMPPSLKALLEPRNSLPVQPPIPEPVALVPPAPVPAALTADQIRAQVVAAEGVRRTEISAAFGGFAAHAELMNACLGDMDCTVDQARTKLLAALGANTTPSGSVLPASHVHSGNGNLVGDSVRAALAARLGHAAMEASCGYNYMRLHELARASLVDRGILVASMDPMQMVGMAFTHTSSDFGNILLDSAHKSVLQGWEQAAETYHLWTKKGQLSDFKTATRVGMGEFPSLREVRPGAEFKYVTVGDHAQTISLATFGELFSITRQAIINDDLSMLSDVPRRMGEAARATIGDLVYAVLTSGPVMRDGKALFHADRKNFFPGAASALSVASMSAAKTAMALQKGAGKDAKTPGRTLNIRPAYVLVPVCLEDKANQIIKSESMPGTDTNSGVINPIRNFAEVIAEPRLDDFSSTAWFMAARQGTDTIEVAYLNGVDTPYVEQQQGFSIDGVVSKVRIDAGVAPVDYRGLNYSTGAK